MTIVYHWTTEENARSILKTGLREYSFICKNKNDWDGEVCLAIEGLEIDWENRDYHADWQALTKFIKPERIRRYAEDLL